MKKRYIAAVVAVFAVGAVVLAGACSRTKTIKTDEGEITLDKKGDVVSIKTEKGSITISEHGMNIQTKEGKAVASFGSKATIPSNLSKDVPVYKPSEVTMSQVLGDGDKIILGLSTKDDSTKVTEFYKKELSNKGWKVGRTMNMGPATLVQGKKGTQKLNVTINKEGEGTVISLAYSGK